jgi:hypothetical protein
METVAREMKKTDFENDLKKAGRKPIPRKHNRAFSSEEEEDYVQRKWKKSGKRSHRKPTPKDSFGEE